MILSDQFSREQYHADPAPGPSLSSSIARIILTQSPCHAWYAHPRLNPDYAPEEASHFDIGTAAHAILLEGSDVAAVLEYNDWRTKAAKEERDMARAAGKVPLLRDQYDRVVAMVGSTREQLSRHREAGDMFTDGRAEQTLLWEEDGIWLRARLDWLHADNGFIDDYKTTAASAHPDAFTRSLYGQGLDIQAAFYRRGLMAVEDRDARFRFCVQENYLPYCLSVIELDPASMAVAERKVEEAIRIWRNCLETGKWPAYPDRTCYSVLPPWEESRWLEYEERTRP